VSPQLQGVRRRPRRGALARLAAAALLVLLATLGGVVLHALWLANLAAEPDPASVIVVLGGGMEDDGTLGGDTAGRTRAGIWLFQAGLAPRIHFTGGVPEDGVPGAGDQMRELAVELGVPPAAASAENHSRSTLQNALMSRDVLGPLAEEPIILVSDGYHLARSWLSFRWAGYRPVALSAASAFGDQPAADQARRVLREALAWWFNLARIAVWHVAELVGVSEADRMALLP
jgi:uncharacterized SAM-binding protein YcdF (DUF218 family)